MSTQAYKLPKHLITYRLDKQARTEPPYTRGRFDVIDYFITNQQWKNNTVKNVYTDIFSGIDSDHYLIIAEISISLKAHFHRQEPRHKYIPCQDQQRIDFNNELQNTQPEKTEHTDIATWIKNAAEAKMTKNEQQHETLRIVGRSTSTYANQERKVTTRSIRSRNKRNKKNSNTFCTDGSKNTHTHRNHDLTRNRHKRSVHGTKESQKTIFSHTPRYESHKR